MNQFFIDEFNSAVIDLRERKLNPRFYCGNEINIAKMAICSNSTDNTLDFKTVPYEDLKYWARTQIGCPVKELAYEINKFTTGYYFLFVVEASAEAEKEFNRVARINESLLRHLIVRVED